MFYVTSIYSFLWCFNHAVLFIGYIIIWYCYHKKDIIITIMRHWDNYTIKTLGNYLNHIVILLLNISLLKETKHPAWMSCSSCRFSLVCPYSNDIIKLDGNTSLHTRNDRACVQIFIISCKLRIAVAVQRGNAAAILATHDASMYSYIHLTLLLVHGCICSVPYFVHVSLCVLYCIV